MALSSLSTVNRALDNIHETASNAPMPLDAIEARRQQRESERLKAYEAQSERSKVNEYAAAGQAERAAQAATQTILQGAPKMKAKDPRDPAFVQQYKQIQQYLYNSGDTGATKIAADMAPHITKLMDSAKLDPGTMEGELTQSIINKNKRSPAGGSGSTPKYPEIATQVKTEDALIGYANKNLSASFPNLAMVANDDGVMVPEKLNQPSMNLLQEAFKNHLQTITKGMPKDQVPREAVQNAWNTVRSSFQVIDYDPWGPGDEQIIIPSVVYNRIKNDIPQASDAEIAAAYLEELGAR